MQSNQEMREQTAQFSKASAVSSAADEDLRALDGLRFLWVELTNRCNLACAHCYAESGPRPSRKDVLTTADYKRLLEEAAALGCRAVQFIGGEPTLHRGLPELITWARALRYEHVQVYTNGTVLPDTLLSCFVDNWVNMAVLVYADDPDVHDAVTRRIGSHRRTISNLQRMVAAGLDVRIGLIAMDGNKGRVDNTVSFLRGLGIENVRVDVTRSFGRGGGPRCWVGSPQRGSPAAQVQTW
jgi:MoaA/NifB/PqqE/SkfB family radical SAM enzyme